MADGSIIIDTAIDSTGISKGLADLTKKGKTALAALTTAIAAAGAAAIKVGADFEAGMSKVEAISGASASEMEQLTAKAKQMGETTKFSATEAASAFEYMAMAGWKTEDMLGGIEGIMNLAAASGEELATVSDIVTDALTAFGLEARDSGRFADVLAAASSNANTNVAMMGETFKYAAPIAGALGYSIEDTAVAVGLMANAGIKAEQAGTSLRSIMTRLSAPPKMAAEAIDDLSLSITKADGTMKPFNEVLTELREKFAGMSQEQQVANAKALAGQEAMSGLLAIVNASERDFNKLTKAVNESAGSAARMAEIMQDNLKGQLTILGSTLEGVGIKIYDKFEKPLKEAVASAIKNVQELSKNLSNGELSHSVDQIAKSMGEFVKSVSSFVTKALPVLLNGFALVVTHGKEIILVFATLKGSMLAYNAVLAITNTLQAVSVSSAGALHLAMSVLTGHTKLATAAQIAWNAVLAASPAGIVAVAVGGLIAVVGGLAIALKNQETELDRFNKTLKEQKQNWDELKEAQQQIQAQNMADVDYTRALWNELQSLADETGKVAEADRDRADFLADEINKLLPDAVVLTGDYTVALDENADAIDRLLEKKRAQIILDSKETMYKEAVLGITEKEIEQTELQIAINQKAAEVARLKAEYEEKQSIMTQSAWATEQRKLTEMQQAFNDNETLLREYYTNKAEYERLSTAVMNEEYDQMEAILGHYPTKLKESNELTLNELEAYREKVAVQLQLTRERFEAGIDGFSETAVTEMEELLSDIDKSIANKREDFYNIGANIVQGVAEGIRSNRSVISASTTVVSDAVKEMLHVGEIHSPSKLTEKNVGKPLAQGIGVGLIDQLPSLIQTAALVVSKIAKSARKQTTEEQQTLEELLIETTETIGERLIDANATTLDKLSALEDANAKKRQANMLKLGIADIDQRYNQLMAAESIKIEEKENQLETLELQLKTSKKDKKLQLEKEALEEELSLLEEFKKNYTSAYETMVSEYEKAYDSIMNKQNTLQEKLAAFGDLYKVIKDENGGELVELGDIKSDIAQINEYGAALFKLESRGASREFIQEVLNMNIEEGARFAKLLLSQSETDLNNYLRLWEEKQKAAAYIAERYYKSEFEALNKNFNEQIETELGLLPEKGRDSGVETIEELSQALAAGESQVRNSAEIGITHPFTQTFNNLKQEAAKLVEHINSTLSSINIDASPFTLSALTGGYSTTDNSFNMGGVVVNHYGVERMSGQDAKAISREIGAETQRNLRGRGIVL